MCMFCGPDMEGNDKAHRTHVLRLLALIEHPEALPPEAVLRIGQEIIALIRPRSRVYRCDPVATLGQPLKQIP